MAEKSLTGISADEIIQAKKHGRPISGGFET
jgi:hypothetical protein